MLWVIAVYILSVIIDWFLIRTLYKRTNGYADSLDMFVTLFPFINTIMVLILIVIIIFEDCDPNKFFML